MLEQVNVDGKVFAFHYGATVTPLSFRSQMGS
jgi:hypothetical protein